MSEIYSLALQSLHAQSIGSKLALLKELARLDERARRNGDCTPYENLARTIKEAPPPQSPSYASFCTITHPTKIRRPKHIKSPQALAKLLHSIAHIEYSAIDLALDALTRFPALPARFYSDWLEVALQERRHFCLLRENLHALGYEYGDFAVHTQLFDAQAATLELGERMALLHRGLEANGLDSNPYVVAKVQGFEHERRASVLGALELILHDEIDHVRKGDRWWRYASGGASSQEFMAILQRYSHIAPLPRVLNIKARLQAGYDEAELALLTHAPHPPTQTP